MKHSTRRNFLKAAGISMTAAAAAACSSSSTSTTTSSTEVVVTEDGVAKVGNTFVEGLPIADEPITYNIMNTKGANDKSNSQNDKDIVKLSTADTNISFTWTETSDATMSDSLQLMLATGEGLPDAIFSTTPSDDQVTANPEDFFAMDEETFRTYAPNITAGLEASVEGGLNAIKKLDGMIYSLPAAVWSEYANWATAITYLRKEWLDNLGLEVPKTVDDLYDVMVAFKNNDPAGDGVAVTPMIFCQNQWAAKLQCFAGSWGIAGRNLNNDQWFGRVENGVYTPIINQQRFRDYLTEMHKWYAAGLINIDGFSLTNSEYQSLMNSYNHGVYTTWTPTVSDWDEGKWIAMPVLTAPGYEGEELKFGEYGMRSANMNTFSITSACKDPIGLLRWWDHCHSTAEWKRIGRDGPEGNAWHYGDDGVAYVKAVDPLPDGCASDTDYHNTYAWRAMSPILFSGESAIPDPEVTTEDQIRYAVTKEYEAYFAPELIPATSIPSDVSSDFSFTKEEIETAVENFMASAVRDGITDDAWNTYCANLEAVGLAEWTEYYQNYVDGNWE